MSNDVLITPASRKIEFKDSSANVDAKIETDASGNLIITNTGGDISIGDTTSDIFVGDGTANVDIVFEQSGEIRGETGVTVTLGQSDSSIRMGTDLNLNNNDITNAGTINAANLNISGTTTTISSTNTTITDSIIELNSGLTVANSKDIGFVFERGSTGNNAAFIWDESADRFTVITTTGTASDDTLSGTAANFQAGSFYGNGANLTSLNGTNISSGTVAAARIASLAASKITSGTFADARISSSSVTQHLGSYLTGNQTITLSGDVSGSGTTSIAVTIADDSHNHVISNVDGLQTALDGKLASSSYTASDVLTKIKTVDGSGSGLDADTLDGTNASGFHTVTSNAGTPGNGNLSIGYDGSTYSYVQSHSSKPLRLNPVGNAVQIGSGNTVFHDAYHPNADTWTTARTITLGGDLSGSVSINGSANVTLTATVADDSHNHVLANVDRVALTSSQSLNDYNTQSIISWGSSQPTNGPGYAYATGFVLQDNNQPQQLVQVYGGNANKVKLYGRRKTSGSWDSTWTQYFSDHYHPNADTWTTARTITLGGDLTGNVSINGSANVTLTATVADDSHNHVISNVDGLQTALDAKTEIDTSGYNGTYNIPIHSGGTLFTTPTAGAVQITGSSGQITTPSHGNSSQWNTAYGWGNHASAGYITSADGGNATTLDTIDSTGFFRNFSNIGTLAVDSITTRGVYGNSNESSGQPFDNNAGTIIHLDGRDTAYKSQIFQYSANGAMYLRGKHGSSASWSSWFQVYDEQHKPTYSELGTMAYSNLTGTPTIPSNNNQLTNGAGYLTSVPNHSAALLTSGTVPAARIAHNTFDIGDTTAETGRSVHETGIYTFNRMNGNLGTGTETSYYSVLAWGQGTNGSAQLASKWVSPWDKLYFRSLRDTTNNWSDWREIYHTSHKPTYSELGTMAYSNLTGTPTIPSLSGYATESYVGTQISNLVDSSPSALNTLNELAAALGDDANFSTTVTNSIATKLPLAGGTMTGDLTIPSKIIHSGDTNTYLQFDADRVRLYAGGTTKFDTNVPYLKKGTDIPGSADLNTYTSAGFYHQNANSNAGSGSNYPVSQAGMLTVTADGSMVYQTYQQYNGTGYYHRSYYNGTWYAWRQIFNDNYHPNADTLTTARTIGGVSFNGSANINLPGVNTAGNQNTSGTAAGLSGTPNITVGTISGTGISTGANLIDLFSNQNGVNELRLDNNRQDLSNVAVSKVSGRNGVEVANMTFYRGGGGSSGFIRFQNKPTNASSLTDVFQVGDGGTVGYGVNIMAGGLRIANTTVIDSSRNLTNIGTLSAGFTHLYKTGSGQTIVAVIGSDSLRPVLQFSESTATSITAGMSIEYNGTGSGATNYMSINAVTGASMFQFSSGGDFRIGSTTVIDSSRNLTNIGTIASGVITATNSGNAIVAKYNASNYSALRYDGVDTVAGGDGVYKRGGSEKLRLKTSGVDVTGTMTASADVVAYSDERLKTNVKTLDGKKALQMRGVSFEKDGVQSSGVIAQEIEKIAPELVHTSDDEIKTKSVAYGNLVGYLIEAVKEQQEQINKLIDRINDLEKGE